jgi:putative addiction module CopG family antidote
VKIGSRWDGAAADAIESGRYASQEEVVNEAMSLLAQRERQFRKLKESLAAALKEGGRLSDEEVEARLRERLAAHYARLAAE